MLDLPESVEIFDVGLACAVQADLVKLVRKLAAKGIDGTWWDISVSKKEREAEGDNHWPWRKLIGKYHNNDAWDALAIVDAEEAVEGAMLYRIDAKSQIAKGEGAIYVDRLATAPRNRPWLVDPPKYRGIGTVLLLAAVRHSYTLGLGGRVGLESLPSEKTREFYYKRGFDEISEDEDGMIYFELSAAKAQEWLKTEGYLP